MPHTQTTIDGREEPVPVRETRASAGPAPAPLSLFAADATPAMPGSLALDTDPAPAPDAGGELPVPCHKCGTALAPGGYRPAYAPLRADAGPLLCIPCESAAWARIDAHAKTMPAQAGNDITNVWD